MEFIRPDRSYRLGRQRAELDVFNYAFALNRTLAGIRLWCWIQCRLLFKGADACCHGEIFAASFGQLLIWSHYYQTHHFRGGVLVQCLSSEEINTIFALSKVPTACSINIVSSDDRRNSICLALGWFEKWHRLGTRTTAQRQSDQSTHH